MRPAAARDVWLARIEAHPGDAWACFALLLGWILLRNLLESLVAPPQVLGFDSRAAVSFGMVFLHFPIFYLTLFLALALWLQRLTGRPLARVARAVTLAFGLLLLVPLIDFVTSGGRGHDLKYLLGLGPEVWRFWDPRLPASVVSPGQRIEIALAVLLAGLYVYRGSRAPRPPHELDAANAPRRGVGRSAAGTRRGARMLLALVGAFGAYALIALLGAWPSLFASWTRPLASSLELAYAQTYLLAGLIPDESRRHALVMAAAALPLLLLFVRALDRARFRAWLRRVSWLRVLHYTGLAPAGAFVAWLVYRDYLPFAYANPVDWVATLVVWASVVAAFLAALLWNDIADRESDRLSAPDRPLVAGAAAGDEAFARGAARLACAAALLALWLALCAGYAPFLLMIGILALAGAYSLPPLRLKRWPLAATLTLGLLSLLSFASGYALFAREMTLHVLPRGFAGLLVVGVTLGFTAKDLKDRAGDRATGVVTLATWLPPRAARAVTAGLVALSFAVAPLWLPWGAAFLLLALVFAAAGAVITWRAPRPDGPLLALLLLFAFLILAWSWHAPERLRDSLPQDLLELQARTAALETETEIQRRLAAEGATPLEASLLAASLPPVEELVARAGELLASGPAARRAVLAPRLRRARARLAAPHGGGADDLAWLIAREPLVGEYHELAVTSAVARGDWSAAWQASRAALGQGVRPGDFLRHQAAVVLAGGAGVDGPTAPQLGAVAHDLSGAFLFGQERTGWWVLYGDLLLRKQRCEAAGAAYRAAIERDPQQADAWAGLAQAQSALGEQAAAIGTMERAAALAPGDRWIANNLGVLLREAGRLEDAYRILRRAAAQDETFFEPRFNLGLTCEALGRTHEARAWYEAAQALRPGFGPVEAAVARLGEVPAWMPPAD